MAASRTSKAAIVPRQRPRSTGPSASRRTFEAAAIDSATGAASPARYPLISDSTYEGTIPPTTARSAGMRGKLGSEANRRV